MLGRTQCIYFESNREHSAKFGYSCGDLFRLFRTAGFGVFQFRDENTLNEVAGDYESTRNENLLAVRDRKSFVERTGYKFA